MTTVEDLLREADPVRHEAPPSREDRERLRRTILARAARPRGTRPMRRQALAAAAVILGAALAVGYQVWPGSDAALHAAVRFEIRLAESEAAPGLRRTMVAGSGEMIYLHDAVLASNGDIADSRVMPVEDPDRAAVYITLTRTAAERMRAATSGHIGRPVAILLDGEVVLAPIVRSPISDAAVIGGRYTRAEAARIAEGIVER